MASIPPRDSEAGMLSSPLVLPAVLTFWLSFGTQAVRNDTSKTISALFHDFLVANDATPSVQAARDLYTAHGLLTIAEVGDQSSYEFVVMLASGRLPAGFRTNLAGQIQAAADAGTIPRDAAAYFAARLRLQAIRDDAGARDPSNPLLRDEIHRLAVPDQAVRQRDGFDPQRVQATDQGNEAPVRAILARFGLPTYDTVGPDASDEFIALIQHQSSQFREQVLAPLRAAVDGNQADPQNYALVYDRLQRDLGKPQLYGEQLECSPSQGLHVAETDDASHVDERRAAIGLFREEIYLRFFVETSPQFCPPTRR